MPARRLRDGTHATINALLRCADRFEKFNKKEWLPKLDDLAKAARNMQSAIDQVTPEMWEVLEDAWSRRVGSPQELTTACPDRSNYWRGHIRGAVMRSHLGQLVLTVENVGKAINPPHRPPLNIIHVELFEDLAHIWMVETGHEPTYSNNRDTAPDGTPFSRFCNAAVEILPDQIRPESIDRLMWQGVASARHFSALLENVPTSDE